MHAWDEIESRARESLSPLSGASELLDLLRDRAPGSYRHSLLVSELWRKAWLAQHPSVDERFYRGAILHDVGKLAVPEAYGENQKTSFNPHTLFAESPLYPEQLRELSSSMITAHVPVGLSLLGTYVQDDPSTYDHEILRLMVCQHHGTFKTWLGHRYERPSEKPRTPETVLLMIADVAQALLANVHLETNDQVSQALRTQVELRMTDGQFDDFYQNHQVGESEVWQYHDAVVQAFGPSIRDRKEPVWYAAT